MDRLLTPLCIVGFWGGDQFSMVHTMPWSHSHGAVLSAAGHHLLAWVRSKVQ